MDFDIRHRKHERHGNADGLTRLHRPKKVLKSEEVIPWNEPEEESGPRYRQSDLHPRLSFLLEPLAVPLLDPGHWQVWRETFVDLSMCLARVQVTWTRTDEHQECIEYVELLIIQAWRTDVDGDLLGFLFGSVLPGHRQPITQELVVPLAQLADDLSLDIVTQSDDSPAPHVITWTLASYLQWTACLEEPGSESTLPSRHDYLKPYGIIDRVFFPKEDPEEALEGEEEATEEEGDADEETSEKGSYSECSEGEKTKEEEEVEEEDEGEEAGSEWEDFPEEVARTGTEAEDLEAA
ncbi:hypothetical protein CBR_g51337 [Chara braunii]|uniref:Uncharacterized protein n=1 Tax=Chara braunii TaxID=69332 RepID=A0A388M8P5_CHABU|nr:hypothetical protein CBR_g51337 [Chara braunii]|eukprot:GBG90832.1 hypothetical protein CBR_g51337 [Chara braunii]